MIDWVKLAMNALWITGCILGLAVLSVNQWQARTRSNAVRLRDGLQRPATVIALLCAAILFSLGMLGTAAAWYEQIAWGVVAIALGIQIWHVRKRTRTH
jgi:hypothetical protein